MPRHPVIPPPVDELDLRRTAAALDEVDIATAKFEEACKTPGLSKEVNRALRELERKEAEVGEAFALDTADRNDPETARRQRPGPWLRALVRQWRHKDKTKRLIAARAAKKRKAAEPGQPLAPVEMTKGYLALRSEALDKANERLAAVDAPTEARSGEQRECGRYEECFNRAANHNETCVPCGRKRTKKKAGCPLMEGVIR